MSTSGLGSRLGIHSVLYYDPFNDISRIYEEGASTTSQRLWLRGD